MLKMVDGTGIIGVDMICPLGISTPQPPNYDRVELEGTGMLVLPNSLDAPLEGLELGGKTEQVQTTGKNLANPSEFVIGTLAGDTGNIINLKQYITTGYIPVIPGKRYSTSCGSKFSAYTIIAYDKEKTKINSQLTMSSEMPEGAAYIRLSYRKIDMTNVTESDMEELKKVCMVNEGSTVLPYEPYTGGKPSPSQEYQQEIKNSGKWNDGTRKYEVDVKVTGRNLLNLRNPSVRFDRCILQGDGSIKSDIRSNYYFCSIYVDDPYVVDNIKNDQAITFSIGKGIQSRSITISLHGERVGSVNYQEKSSVPGGNSVSIVPSGFKKVSKIELRFNRSGSLFTDTETVVRDFMIHFGESTPYQPYKEQTLTLTSDRPLTKWDRLVEQGGQIGWLYNTDKYIVTGQESFETKPSYVMEETVDFAFMNNKQSGIRKAADNFCNRLTYVDSVWSKHDVGFGISGVEVHIRLPLETIGASSSDESAVIKTKFSEYLKKKYDEGGPFVFYHKSKTTEFIPLPQSEQNAIRALKTYYPTTVITVDGGELDPDIKATYRKEI